MAPVFHRLLGLALGAALVAACGSAATPAPTGNNGPGTGTGAGASQAAGTGNGNGSTRAPGNNSGNSGNKPAGWDKFGKVSYTITGGVSASGELGFVPAGSLFGGPTNSSLSFYIENTNTVFILRFDATATLVQWGDGTSTVPAATCTTTNLRLDSTGGSGSFECVNQMGMNQNGAIFTDVKVTGSFTAKPS